jgi:uncharacterized membrane protein
MGRVNAGPVDAPSALARLRLAGKPSKTAPARVEAQLNFWLHLLAMVVYVGATLGVVVIAVPRARREKDPRRRLAAIAATMRIYDPLAIATLGVLVMTGAFRLTGIKAALRERFFEYVGVTLAWKLLFAFLVINLAAYVAFGIGHRLVVRLHDPEPVPEQWLDAMLKRLQISSIVTLLLVGVVVWISLGIHAGLVAPA